MGKINAKKFLYLFILESILLYSGFALLENNTFVNSVNFTSKDFDLEKNLRSSGYWILDSISIDGAATGGGAHNWDWAVSQPWCNGSGTLNYPYIIENITINGEESDYCLNIKNSDKHFTVRNCTFYNASAGLELENINHGKIQNNTCYNNKCYGIRLKNSLYSKITNNSLLNNGYEPREGFWFPEDFPRGGGVALWSSHENLIINNYFDLNADFGVALGDTITLLGDGTDDEPCYDNIVGGNLFNNTGSAIWTLPQSEGNNLTDNKILDSTIYLEGSIGTTLLRNIISNGLIWLRGSVGAESSYNIDTSNTIDGRHVYYYVDESNLNKNNFPDAGQVILVNCRNSIIENVSFIDCHFFSLFYCSDISLNKSVFADSILLRYTNSCHITGNNFTNSCDIFLYYSNNNIISQNSANTSFLLLSMIYSNDNKISDNNFITKGTPWLIIHLVESDYNELSRNFMQFEKQNFSSYERIGIELDHSHYNSIIENNILNTDIGIYVEGSRNNMISGNLINDTDIGIFFDFSNYNSITYNILIVRNACFYVSGGSDGNVFENNYCNIPFEQIIPGYPPVLILICITLISIVFYIYKNNMRKKTMM